MANALSSFTNHVDAGGVTFATDSEVSGLSSSNVANSRIQVVWRTSGAASFYIQIDFSTTREVGVVAVAIPRSGVMPDSTETIRLRLDATTAGSGALLDTGTAAAGWDARRGYWLRRVSTAVQARYVRIDFGGATQYRDIGRVWAGPVFQPAIGMAYDWSQEWQDAGVVTYAPKSGVRFSDAGARRRQVSFAFRSLTQAEADTADDGAYDVGATGQMLVCTDPDTPARTTLIGRAELNPITQPYFARFAASYTAIEDL